MSNELDLLEQILSEKLSAEQVKSLMSRLTLAAGDGSVAIEGGAAGAVIITGNQNIVGDNNAFTINPGIDAEELARVLHKLLNPQKVSTQFRSLIADKTEGFVGREYVFDAIQSFINDNPKGYFTITGDPGMGKSAILAKYSQDTGCIAHFNVQLQGLNRADQFLEGVCKQLIDRYQLPYDSLPLNATQDGEFLGQLLDEAAQNRNGQPVIIAVDALDEVDAASYKNANILYLPPHLPEGVYFILTRRRDVEVPLTSYTPKGIISLLDYQVDSQRDVRSFIQNRVEGSEKLRQQIDERKETTIIFTDKIADKSENNFMYLRYVLQDIESGAYKDLSLENFPQGLGDYYDFHWRRMGMDANPLPIEKIRIVYVLGEVREPVSRRKICDFSGEEEYTVQKVLTEWQQFLHELMKESEKRYSVYHSSFRDFLHRQDVLDKHPVTIPGIHQAIARNELKVWAKFKQTLKNYRNE
jgi:Effector-associated domain 10